MVITNLHVIEGSIAARVRLANNEAYDEVVVVDVDAARDLAVLKVKGVNFPHVEIGDSALLKVGDTVYAIGSPQSLAQSLSEGLVSAIRDMGGHRMIQTTAAISNGSSGGGLFDTTGLLVGITSNGNQAGENLNFAVPINYAKVLMAARSTYPLSELREHSIPLGIDRRDLPSLPSVFRNASGEAMILEQHGLQLRVTFQSRSGVVSGHADLSWNASLQGFDGSGFSNVQCGDRPAVESEVKFEQLFVVTRDLVRTRALKPGRVDCAQRTVKTLAWQESFWSAR